VPLTAAVALIAKRWSRERSALGPETTKIHNGVGPEIPETGADGEVALRVRDLIREIAMEHELEIISGKVARDHVHVFISYPPTQRVSQIMQWLKGTSSRVLLQEFSHLRKKFWGAASGFEAIWP
jgi:REP-associated tyrosine transposase